MGKKSPSPPPAPDPVATAQAQGAANKEAAIASTELNLIDQDTPYGSVKYSHVGTGAGGTPRYKATQTLSPEQQQILDLNNRASINYGETANNQLEAVQGALSKPLDFSTLGQAPTLNEETRQNVAQSIIQRNQPNFDRRYEQMQSRLANQGFTDPSSSGYREATDEYYRGLNDFELAADASALGQASQLYGIEANQRDRAINEMVQERSIPLNETAAMLSGSQVQNPNFVGTPQSNVAAAPVADATYSSYQGNLNNYNQQVAQQNAQTQGRYSLLGTAGGAAMAFSDARLKRDIKRIGTLASGLGLYSWKYIWGGPRTSGVMAHEVKTWKPEAVVNIGGFDAVNYAEVW
jgi:hypothetical protein